MTKTSGRTCGKCTTKSVPKIYVQALGWAQDYASENRAQNLDARSTMHCVPPSHLRRGHGAFSWTA